MPNEDAAPVIFLIVSLYGFAIVLLYVLARSWEKALSTRQQTPGTSTRSTVTPPSREANRFGSGLDERDEAICAKLGREQTDKQN